MRAEEGLVEAVVMRAEEGLGGREAVVVRAEEGLGGREALVVRAEEGLGGREAVVAPAMRLAEGPEVWAVRRSAMVHTEVTTPKVTEHAHNETGPMKEHDVFTHMKTKFMNELHTIPRKSLSAGNWTLCLTSWLKLHLRVQWGASSY
ncbi:UNVERIFIED_CONTAM: hypothetical protein FKN15_063738 [Acipenser sinensis]